MISAVFNICWINFSTFRTSHNNSPILSHQKKTKIFDLTNGGIINKNWLGGTSFADGWRDIQKFNAEIGKTGSKYRAYLNTLREASPWVQKVVKDNKLQAVSFKEATKGAMQYGVHLVGATIKTVALQAASMALNAALTWGVSLAIQGIIAGVQALWKLVPTTEHLKKSLEETAQAVRDNNAEIDSLNNELSTTANRIKELQSQGQLSLTDEAELLQLQKENAELERKIRLLKDANVEAQKKAIKDFNNAVDKPGILGDNHESFVLTTTTGYDPYDNTPIKERDYVGVLQYFDELQSAYETAIANTEKTYTDALGRVWSLSELDELRDEYSDKVQDIYEDLTNLYDAGYVYGTDKETDKNIDRVNEYIDRYSILKGEAESVFSEIYNRDKYAEARKSIQELLSTGTLTAQSLQDLYESSDNIEGGVKDFIDYTLSLNSVDWKTILGQDSQGQDIWKQYDENQNGFIDSTEVAKLATENWAKVMPLLIGQLRKVKNAAIGATSAIKSFTDIADSFQDGYDAIVNSQKDIEEQNYLSADSVKALEKAGLSDYLKETEYGYLLVNDALNTYLEAQGKKYKDALDTAISQASSLATMQDAVAAGYKNDASGLATYLRVLGAANNAMARNEFKNNLISKGFTVTEAHRMWMSSQQRIAADQAQSEYIAAANAIDAAIKNQKTYEMVRKTAQNDIKYSSDSKSGKTEAEKYFEEQKYLLETNQITQEEYLKRINQKYKEFYKNQGDDLEDYAKYSQEVYDGFKDMYKEDLEAQKEAWEKKKDAVSEYYDKLREEIENTHDEEDYEKEQSEKRKEIFDLDMQIAELMRDGSEKAKARIAELEEERLKAEEELRDFETDKAREKELSRLEKEQKAEEDKIQAEIDKIDDDLKSIDENITKARQDIINYARAKGVKLDFAYASGTRSSIGGFGRINEKGIEMISAPDGNGNYVNLMPGSYVFSAKATEFLWKLATEHSLPQAMYNSIAKSIKTQSSTPSVNIAQPITITMGDIIIKGNADKQTVADIKKQQDDTVRMVLQKIKELQK